ncbi:glycosyltransferase family 1 protein [Didymella exigua CBS 183.55]|uniref:Glycosyltransferase family 1 protein n=1 Tax=Didymella exigua CBS 183.55 TaxID=1150837 RepID=A0A6A5R6C4_9PLEO|nr:glycosyltransferase family 1 protein [Didymella exigua CBS 183.55]KAF1923701.1 glycosyltransferase family 1 protein [Didymella exigua CBS 183.55]
MSSSNNPSDANARDGGAPSTHPPQYSEQGVTQPPGHAPTNLSRALPTAQRNAPPPPESKPEASSYVGSYRPSDSSRLSATTTAEPYHDLGHVDEQHATPADLSPPAYSEVPGTLQSDNDELDTNATVAEDGRVNIRINQKSRALSQLIVPQIQRQLTQAQEDPEPPPPYIPESLGGAPGQSPPPPLNIVIQVVGSRGDVQPFVALGKVLKDTYGHRVRLATHPTFKDFVIENGLEFFSIGGDPAELMAFMVKNPGLMPGMDTLWSGDVGKRRKGIAEILRGTWRSCIEPGNGLGVDPLKQTVEEWMGVEEQLPEQLKKPFVADAIIANPPAFGHIHCAEKLGIPLHMMFTMPWSPTQQFPHPLANIQSSNADPTITNYMSYIMVDLLTWQGLGDIINRFRKESLSMDPISMIWAPAMLARMKVPFTYCWSPALIPKPSDWSHNISIAGFYFLDLAQNYTPEPALKAFLDAGEPPVYIGFGSIVVDDPNAMTKMIFDAVKITGRRALVSKGWGGLGADELGIPQGVFMLGNCPHDWLFKRVSAVVHHGGAGTTAAGIAAGRPTVVVPFFGDQPFWGAMVARAGAGPDPTPYKELTAEKLAESINKALEPQSLERAQELCNKIKQENGSQSGAQSFHQMLNYDDLRCAVVSDRPAVWRVKRTQVKLSAKAATVLAQEGEIDFKELKLARAREYQTDEGPWDPVSGAASALTGTATSMMMGVADMPIQTLKLLNIHPDARAASKKGKERAQEPEGTSNAGDSSRSGRPTTSRTATGADSVLSGESTPPMVQSPGLDEKANMRAAATSPGAPGSLSHRSTSMTEAVSASAQRSRPSSRGLLSPDADGPKRKNSASSTGPSRSDTGSSSNFTDNLRNMQVESAVDTGKGLARIVGAGFKSPMDFSLNVAKGFHNVPKLYGGEVRKVDNVTDFKSGITTAAKQFGFGLYDGITGIVTDPYKGAKKEGGVGFVKGVGRGIFSVPFRVMGGAWAVPGYAMKGLYQEMIKSKGSGVQNYIIAARMSQGYDESIEVSPRERADIVSRWKIVKVNMKKKKKNPGGDTMDSLQSLVADKRKRKEHRWNRVDSQFQKPEARQSVPPTMSQHTSYSEVSEPASRTSSNTLPAWKQQEQERMSRVSTTQSQQSQQTNSQLDAQLIAEEEAERRELEAAIAASVAENSHGNAEEDQVLARAIRASVAELERAPAGASEEDGEEMFKRAMHASMEEAGRTGATEEEQNLLEETLRKSLLDTSRHRQHGSDSEWDSSDTENDADFQRIIAESKELAHLQDHYPQDYQGAAGAQESGTVPAAGDSADAGAEDEELMKALEESERAEKQRRENASKEKSEDEIVMEYIKKQSLMEEEHRQRRLQGRDAAGESSGAGAGSGSS